jgi:hypothetical protein
MIATTLLKAQLLSRQGAANRTGEDPMTGGGGAAAA